MNLIKNLEAMYKRYLKQSWELLKQNKLFSFLYLSGTALAITMTMVIVIFYHIRTAPIYPETDRSHLWVLQGMTTNGESYTNVGGVSHSLLNEWFYSLTSADIVSAVNILEYGVDNSLLLPNGLSQKKIDCKYTDAQFFQLFSFEFLEGKPFSQSDLESRLPKAVICSRLARELFGTTSAIGKQVTLDFVSYTVTGVVKDASQLTPISYGQLYVPYTCHPNFDSFANRRRTFDPGPYAVYFKVSDPKAFREEISQKVNAYNHMLEKDGFSIQLNGPDPYRESLLRSSNTTTDYQTVMLKWGSLLLIFLLVPAMNLGGMISHRMESRMTELGISRAFGATRSWLFRQVMNENLILTLLGGVIGLMLTWIIILFFRSWIFSFFEVYSHLDTDYTLIAPSMLFSPGLFAAAFLLCLLLNLFSGLLPVWKSLRKSIVYSLNQKK